MSADERRDEADRRRRRRLGRTARLGRQSTATTLETVRAHHCHTHTRTTRVSRYQKVEPIWILLKQETVRGSGISWAICKPAPLSRQITMQHAPLRFLQAGCLSCRPTNSVKALKALPHTHTHTQTTVARGCSHIQIPTVACTATSA